MSVKLVACLRADLARRQGELTSRGHGVARVGGQVEQHLLDLAGVQVNGGQRGIEIQMQLAGGAEEPFTNFATMEKKIVQIDVAEFEHLPATEGEQLANQRGGTVGGLLNLSQRRVIRIAGAMRFEQHA